MTIKSGVKLKGLKPEMALAATVVESVYQHFHHECTITSALDGKHSTNSLHYSGNALDFRTRDISSNITLNLRKTVEDRLGPEFDVVLEQDHLHVEFQPKE